MNGIAGFALVTDRGYGRVSMQDIIIDTACAIFSTF